MSLLPASQIENIFHIFQSISPTPQIELKHTNAFTLLIAVLLSAQSTDKMVNICTEELFRFCDSPEKMLQLSEEGLILYIKKIGLYRNKAKNIINLCKTLIAQHKSKVPDNFDDLIKLSGVGRKTADVVLNTWFGKETIAVDRHIFRIVHRIGITSGKNTDEVSNNLLKIVPKQYLKYAHHWLVLHGRYICKALKPQCATCPIFMHCHFWKNISSS
jgi:endonuclease-3